MSVEQQVTEQFNKFEAELPTLMLTHLNEWVVYRDGPVRFFDEEHKAVRWACEEFDLDVGFVVAEVAEQKVHVLSPLAMSIFGM